MRIRIAWKSTYVTATLHETPTARALAGVLPCVSQANTWGEEVYFAVPTPAVALEPDAQQVVEPGTVCFWVEGNSLALPYGPTPISIGDECRLAARTNIVGQLDSDPRVLATVRDGDAITVSLVEDES